MKYSSNQRIQTKLNYIGVKSGIPNLEGRILLDGKYTVNLKINVNSGEAELYVCTDNLGIRHVAKVYCRQDAVKVELLDKLSKLKSPYIAEVQDYGFVENYPIVILPYFKNGSLAGKTFSFDEIRDVIVPCVAKGLKYLHDNNILHKDIKPSNLMIADDGERILIIDFGISSLKASGQSVIVTKTGMSPEYSAPETFNNVFLAESDYYSFGITLYELFTGHTPFALEGGLSSDEIAAYASVQNIPFSENFPERLKLLIMGLTYKDLSNRTDLDNPNRRWDCHDIENWCNGKTLPVPGVVNIGDRTDSSFCFTVPYDFINDDGKSIIIKNLAEFVDAFGTYWEKGKKQVGRGFVSAFFKKQELYGLTDLVMDCEEEKITDLAYFKMIAKMEKLIGMDVLYWKNSKFTDLESLAGSLIHSVLAKSSGLKKNYLELSKYIPLWYAIFGKTPESLLAEKFIKLAYNENYDFGTRIIGICSILDPNMKVVLGDNSYLNISEFQNTIDNLKNSSNTEYEKFILENIHYIDIYSKCPQTDFSKIFGDLSNEERQIKHRIAEDKRRKAEEIERKKKEEEDKKRRNPVLNSRSDISENLRNDIESNYLESLTINYQFTRFCKKNEQLDHWESEQRSINPFWGLSLKRIKFKIILGSEVTSLDGAFAKQPHLEYVNLKDTSKITSMQGVFWYASTFNQPIGDWDTSKVTTMSRMFEGAQSFNQSIGDWDTSNVTDMGWMFAHAIVFNQPIGNWNVSNVNNMNGMFFNAKSFNQNIDNWDTSEVREMGGDVDENYSYWWGKLTRNCGMFCGALSFNQPIGNWNTSKVISMGYMFKGASVFNQPIGNWDTSKVCSMKCIFDGAKSFNQSVVDWVTNLGRSVPIDAWGNRRWVHEDCPSIIVEQRKQREKQRKQREEQRKQNEDIFKNAGYRILQFGNYWIDNTNVKSPIKWIVLRREGIFSKRELLLSLFSLDFQEYSNISADDWGSSHLRYWLNNVFFNCAFSKEEQERIVFSTIKNDAGNNIKDRIFCLSWEEVNKYFCDDTQKRCCSTVWASEKINANDTVYFKWWLRSPVFGRVSYGKLDTSRKSVHQIGAVRPALWIKV